jgi:carbamoyl-phosphate synthase large subunit
VAERSEITAVAVGAALGAAAVVLWKRLSAPRRAVPMAGVTPAKVSEPRSAPAEPPPQASAAPPTPRAGTAALPAVLVTGAGRPAGVCVIRALKAAGARVVAADSDETAVGLQLADAGGTIPTADEHDFVAALCELAAAHGAQTIVSTVAEDVPALAKGSAAFAVAGLASWLPNPAAVRTCLDKWTFAQAVAAAKIPHPPTNLGRANGVGGPWIVKSRFGGGANDVHTVDDPAELPWAIAHTPHALVQTRVDGLEFAIDALVDRGGELVGAVPRWRLEKERGVSTKGRTFEDRELVAQAQHLVSALGLEGPVSIRGFMLSSNGLYCFTHVNPSFSGGLSLSLAAGADLVGEYVRGIVGLPLRRERLAYEPGVTTERFYDEVVITA